MSTVINVGSIQMHIGFGIFEMQKKKKTLNIYVWGSDLID